jgi:hypothetical protein
VYSPRSKDVGFTLAGRWVGGGSIFWKTSDIGLASCSIISPRTLVTHPLTKPTIPLVFEDLEKSNHEKLFSVQVGNPDGEDKPNKKFYDPRVWVRAAEESLIKRAHQSFSNLSGINILGDDWPQA